MLLPTKLEPAAEDRARRVIHAEEEVEEERCRLCLEGTDDGPLVQPCACRGSAKLAHKHCLNKWRRKSPKEDAAYTLYRCGQCMDHYRDALSLELLSARLQAERATGESTSFTLDTFAKELHAQGKFDEAEPLFREVLEVSRARRSAAGTQTRSPPSATSARYCGTRASRRGPAADVRGAGGFY